MAAVDKSHESGSASDSLTGLPLPDPPAACDVSIPVHSRFNKANPPPYESVRYLGHGSLGYVEEVRPLDSTEPLVRKVINLPPLDREQLLEIIDQEVKIMRSLSHQHIVKLIGTYESESTYSYERNYGILMLPIGDGDLSFFMGSFEERDNREQETSWLRKWLRCLASAVAYIHAQGVRHEDIKPSNIIHKGGNVFLTDFSSCSQFDLGTTTSTDSQAGRFTRIYSAPEVLSYGRHGLGSDIFSLGCVFSEIATILDGKPIRDYSNYRAGTKSEGASRGYSTALNKIDGWFDKDNSLYTTCIKPMMAVHRKARPNAQAVIASLAALPSADLLPCKCFSLEGKVDRLGCLLDELKPENCEESALQILEIINELNDDDKARTLRGTSLVLFERATRPAGEARLYAVTFKHLIQNINPNIKDEKVLDRHGNAISGPNLCRKYLLNPCQEQCEKVMGSHSLRYRSFARDVDRAPLSFMPGDSGYAKRLFVFLGELNNEGLVTDRIVNECAKAMLDLDNEKDVPFNVIDILLELLKVVGPRMETYERGRILIHTYVDRIEAIYNSYQIGPETASIIASYLRWRENIWYRGET